MAIENLNPNLAEIDEDFLYHLGLTSKDPLPEMFGDTKFVLSGGSGARAEKLAAKVSEELGLPIVRFHRELDEAASDEKHLLNIVEEGAAGNTAVLRLMKMVQEERVNIREATNAISRFMAVKAELPTPIGKTERFEMFKVGPVVIVSHGMGMPSMQIQLDETTKLLHYAGAEDFKYIRIGTSGGVGVEGGDVVIADEAMSDLLKPVYEKTELGRVIQFPTHLSEEMAEELMVAATAAGVNAQIGKTMGTDDFYLGQGRLDGALDPGYTVEDKMEFLERAHEAGIRNIEMESAAFAAFCLRAGIPASIVCCALLNRLDGDQVTSTAEELAGFSDNAENVVIQYLRTELADVIEGFEEDEEAQKVRIVAA